jgi:REP element-mobilizing transposase RayT
MGSKYDPRKHHRRSIRLKGWDYTNPAAYFVTICTYHREYLFDNPRYREIAENTWRHIPSQPHAKQAILDEWIVMPNHLHGIIILTEKEGETTAEPQDKGTAPGSLPSMVSTYKSLVTRRINNLRRSPGGKVWQRGYYERIVRNERELNAIRQYIRANPSRWAEDRDNLDALIVKMQKINP